MKKKRVAHTHRHGSVVTIRPRRELKNVPTGATDDDGASTGDGGAVVGGTERVYGDDDGDGGDRANDVVRGAGTRRPETTRGWEQCVGITNGSERRVGGGGRTTVAGGWNG